MIALNDTQRVVLSDQLLLNLVLLAAADLPGSTIAGSMCDTVGAKLTALRFFGAASTCVLAFAAFEAWAAAGGAEMAATMPLPIHLVPAALSLLGKSLCSGAFTATMLLFNENYPVMLRSAALGSGLMFGKMGASSAPLLATALPLFAVLGLSGGALLAATACVSTLPESQVQPKVQPASGEIR